MKIIGKGEYCFIVEMSRSEIAQITGDGYRIGPISESEHDLLIPGRELKIGEKWTRLNNLDRKAEEAADSLPKSLRMMADLIEIAGTSLIPVPDQEVEE